MKRAELKPGERYVIRSRIKPATRSGMVGVYCYDRVKLISTASNGKAMVEQEITTWDIPPSLPNATGRFANGPKKAVTIKKVRTVSIADFLASEADWDTYPKVPCKPGGHLKVDYSGEQGVLA